MLLHHQASQVIKAHSCFTVTAALPTSTTERQHRLSTTIRGDSLIKVKPASVNNILHFFMKSYLFCIFTVLLFVIRKKHFNF